MPAAGRSRTPRRWDRIQAIAAETGTKLPDAPDSKALSEFLAARKEADPDRFPELSLAVLKSLGLGEYGWRNIRGTNTKGILDWPVGDYTHSTAPNRRFADVVTQRLLKAAIQARAKPVHAEGH